MRRLEVPAVVESLEPVNALVQNLAAEAGLTPAAAYSLRLATEELFVNIVRHGYGQQAVAGAVAIEAGVADDRVWLRLIDSADAFDPFAAATPAGLDQPLQERQPGALGLYLTRHAVDAASHEYVDGRNRTTVAVWRADDNGDEVNDHGRDDSDRQRMQ